MKRPSLLRPFPHRPVFLLLVLAGLWNASEVCVAQEPRGEQWAILIGCEGYRFAAPLEYTVNDVEQLGRTLQERNGIAESHIIKFTDVAEKPELRPSRANLMEQLPMWFRQPESGDRLIVYYSGHGFKTRDDRLYLAPLDCDPARPAETGLAVSWLRDQIAACPAKFKLLILDSCHAGTEKSVARAGNVTAKDLGEPFRDLKGVITLASSAADEKSLLWQEKRQSLFTYWLNQALKGHADEDGDSVVDVDELNKYVYANVTFTAKARFQRAQTPVRIIRAMPGVPPVVTLQPMTLKQLISSMADEIAYAMESRQVTRVGVPYFTTDTALGEVLGADFGALGKWCGSEMQMRLIRARTFDVVDADRLLKAMTDQGFSVDQFGSPDAMQRLSRNLGGMPAIAVGTLRHRRGRTVTLQCRLKNIETGSLLAVAGGTALLNENEWAMLGHSVTVSDRDLPNPALVDDPQDELIRVMDEKAKGPHPMQDPRAAGFRVYVRVGGRERKATFRGNDMIVALRKGETFDIIIELFTNETLYARVLVDGLNTLPQKAEDPRKGIETMEVAPVVKLDEARGYILDPKRAKRYVIMGFVTQTGVAGKLRRFEVVDAGESWAARKHFTENIGLITVALYSVSADRAIGVAGEARETDVNLRERKGFKPSAPRGIVHIRYAEPEAVGGM